MSAMTKSYFCNTPAADRVDAAVARPSGRGRLREALALVRLWSRRARDRRRLATLPPHLLRDMGIMPDDARLEAAKPFWRS